MPYNDELEFEQALINYLQKECSWNGGVIKYPTEEDLIENWANILFKNNKEKEVLNNCPLTEGEMAQILSQINSERTPVNLNKNIINGGSISIKRDNKDDEINFGTTVSLKIYDRREIAGGNTVYQIVEQPRFKTNNEIYPNRRGDIMLLINGMPLFHIELKKSGIDISHAEVQIEKYMKNDVFTGIFSLVQIFVAMNPEEAVYYANPGRDRKFNPAYYFHWEDYNNNIINKWSDFAKQVLYIPMAHEMIGYYTIPDSAEGVLKVLRSYQFWAVWEIFKAVPEKRWTKDDRYGGYIWHTTGSGKTMTSFKAAQLLALSGKVQKVVFLIDRVDLGKQSLENYNDFDPTDSVEGTVNTNMLINKLKDDSTSSNILIVTSIQKMSRITEDGDIKLKDLEKIRSKRIVFIIDECHRDQKGEMHQNVKRTFPNAIFFGFTGTPDHETTKDIFGNELHRYTIFHGIRDKNVLGFDPYKICTFNDNAIREQVALEKSHCASVADAMENEDTKRIFLHYMNKSDKKCPMTEIEKFVPAVQYDTDKHRGAVVDEILKNWIIRSVGSKFHAIFATSSIPEAIKYYNIFKSKEHDLKITAIFDPSDNNSNISIDKMMGITDILTDYKELFGNSYDINTYHKFKEDVRLRLAHKEHHRNLPKEKQLNIVIVVDQLLTGYDSKWVNTLYLDKKLEGKSFIQAISRTNRLFGPDKPHGTIIWYRYPHTMEMLLEKAIKEYSGDIPFGIFVDKLDKNLEQMNVKYLEIKDMFESVGIDNFERLYDNDAWKKKFAKSFSELNQYLDSAKIQGFVWDKLTYEFNSGDVRTIQLLFDKRTYLILVQRYKELFLRDDGRRDDVPYDIDTHITEIQTDTIDDEYMNSKFVIYIKNLNVGDPKAREEALNELHRTFSTLSEEDQKIARILLNDIETGSIEIEKGKTFRDYITQYKYERHNDRIHRLATGLGLNEEMLRELIEIHPDEQNINAYGRFDNLKSTIEINTAKNYLERWMKRSLTKREAIMEADKLLRRFIIEGGFDVG